MSVKHSTLTANYQSTPYELLSHRPFTGTFTGTLFSTLFQVHDLAMVAPGAQLGLAAAFLAKIPADHILNSCRGSIARVGRQRGRCLNGRSVNIVRHGSCRQLTLNVYAEAPCIQSNDRDNVQSSVHLARRCPSPRISASLFSKRVVARKKSSSSWRQRNGRSFAFRND